MGTQLDFGDEVSMRKGEARVTQQGEVPPACHQAPEQGAQGHLGDQPRVFYGESTGPMQLEVSPESSTHDTCDTVSTSQSWISIEIVAGGDKRNTRHGNRGPGFEWPDFCRTFETSSVMEEIQSEKDQKRVRQIVRVSICLLAFQCVCYLLHFVFAFMGRAGMLLGHIPIPCLVVAIFVICWGRAILTRLQSDGCTIHSAISETLEDYCIVPSATACIIEGLFLFIMSFLYSMDTTTSSLSAMKLCEVCLALSAALVHIAIGVYYSEQCRHVSSSFVLIAAYLLFVQVVYGLVHGVSLLCDAPKAFHKLFTVIFGVLYIVVGSGIIYRFAHVWKGVGKHKLETSKSEQVDFE